MVGGKIAIIIDDLLSTGGTMVAACEELNERGINGVIIVTTHGEFKGKAIEKINACDIIKQVVVTNTLPQENNVEACNKITVIDTSDTFAEVIRRLTKGGSISELFE